MSAKKGSSSKNASKATETKYTIGQRVLGKVRGFPPWPGMVVDPSSVPPVVASEQPTGKKATFYCVIFFPTGDYAWLHSKDMSNLQKHEVESFLADDKKSKGDLKVGYRISLDPEPWMEGIKRKQEALEEVDDNAEIDQLDGEVDVDGDGEEDGGDVEKKKSASKKRKRDTDDKPKKANTSKAKKTSKKDTGATSVSAAGGRKNGRKSKHLVESEDDGDHEVISALPLTAVDKDDLGPSARASPPPTKKVKRDKDDDGDEKSPDAQSARVREWRHKLQKTFLPNKATPKAEDMAAIDGLFKTVEEYEEMTIDQLQFSKIGKVMRHVAALPEEKIPRDSEFKFRERAKALVDKWHHILNANKSGGGGANESPAPSKEQEKTIKGGSVKKEAKMEMTDDVAVGSDDGDVKAESADEDKVDADDVTQGTKNLDLNGKGTSPDAPGEVVPTEASTKTEVQDVAMAEA